MREVRQMKFQPKLIENAEEVDALNVEIFAKHGTKNSEEVRHTCLTCGKKVSIYDSMSDEGRNLICKRCAWGEDIFPDCATTMQWIYGAEYKPKFGQQRFIRGGEGAIYTSDLSVKYVPERTCRRVEGILFHRCSECGAVMRYAFKFCSQCGARVVVKELNDD